ncbi:MAG TPA: LysR family transcriptional regulator [Candidatus Yaniella excrementigallinarum]|nr:LysR family transcriptional regulator [Candidatus Yaniella excrementigallinarum]
MIMDLNKLNHLIAVGDEGSITAAAERVHLSQQALSTSIRSLEREVGVPLLDRGNSGVKVLPAGQALIDDARILHGMAGTALQRARRIGRGETETLRIGHTPAVTGEEVAAWLHQANDIQTEVTSLVHQRYPDELITELTDGDLDLGLCRAIEPPHGIARTLLGHHRLRVAMSVEHHLATTEQLRLQELANERILVWGEPGRSGYTDLLIDYCRQTGGFEPHVERTARQGMPPVTAVDKSNDVAFVTHEPGTAAAGRVQVLELQPPIYAPLHALWHQHTSSHNRDMLLSTPAS